MLRRSGLIAATIVLAACADTAAPNQGKLPLMPVGVATPIARELATERVLTGQIEAVQWVELRARVGGTITEVLVADGAEVTAGTLLFRIDQAPAKAGVAKAEADLARAVARHEQARLQFDRARTLLGKQMVSQQDYDDAQAALHAAEADVAATTATRNLVALDLAYTEIRAPISGRIGRIQATVGNLIQASGVAPGTLLATLVASDPVYAAFDVDETLWHAIGARLRASADAQGAGDQAVPVRVELSGEQRFPHLGALTFIDNRIDPSAGSIRVRARFANPDRALTPGSFARISLQSSPPRPVLLVNERAVLSQLATRYVLTVDDQGLTAFRPVKLGEAVGDLRIIESGLAAGERIAVNNLTMLFPGRSVLPLPASMETLQNDPPPSKGGTQPAAAGKPGK